MVYYIKLNIKWNFDSIYSLKLILKIKFNKKIGKNYQKLEIITVN